MNEASSFWKALWELEGDGNIEAEWLDEIRCVMRENIPDLPEGSFELRAVQAKRVILKKKNWSAPGADHIVNYWWKRVNIVHDGIARAFHCIVSYSQESQCFRKWLEKCCIGKPVPFQPKPVEVERVDPN